MFNFQYISPETLEEAENCFKNRETIPGFIMAGGTDFLGILKENILEAKNIFNIKNIKELQNIEEVNGVGIKIGALVKIDEIEYNQLIQSKLGMLSQTAGEIASPQLRNVGTIGGNLCQRPRCWYFRGDFDCYRKGGGECFSENGENKFHCVIGGKSCFIVHPSDFATTLMALDAKLMILRDGKQDTISIHDFFVLPEVDIEKENILKSKDILTHIVIPENAFSKKGVFIKGRNRETFDFATVSVAITADIDGNKIRSGRIVLGGVAPIPWFEKECSQMLKGLILSDGNIQPIADNALKKAIPLRDNGYKVILAKNLIKKALRELGT